MSFRRVYIVRLSSVIGCVGLNLLEKGASCHTNGSNFKSSNVFPQK